MAYVIISTCERDGKCVAVCPVDAIHFVENDAAWPVYYINPETCIDCGACEPECPTTSIYAADAVPAEYQAEVQKNADFYSQGPGQNMK